MTDNRTKTLRVHDAKLTDQEVRIVNYFRKNHPGEVQQNFLAFLELVLFSTPEVEEYRDYRQKIFDVWGLINAIEPVGILSREELAENPEKLHI